MMPRESGLSLDLPVETRTGLQTSTRVYLILITSVAALGGVLFGYDTAVISGAIAFLQNHFALSAVSTGWTASSALAGCVMGAALTGYAGDRFGRRMVLLIAAVFFLVSSVGAALAPSLAVLVLFRIMAGVGIGAASMTSPLYIAEIAPAAWRGRLVSINQLAIVSGMLLIYFVNYRIARAGSEAWNVTTGWRWMFASGAVPSVLLVGLLFFVPETPRFLLARGRLREAAEVLQRTGGDSAPETPETQASMRSVAVVRIMGIGIILAVLQQVTGINVFLYYAPQIFSHVARNTNSALLQTVVVGAVNLCFTGVAMVTVDRAGRRPLMIGGSVGMGVCLVAMGRASLTNDPGPWLLLFVLGYIAFFALSVGPVTWIILTEIFPMPMRNRALAVATMALWLANFGVSQTFPSLDQNPALIARFHHAFPFFLYALFCAVEALFVWLVLPETKDMSLEQIGARWAAGG